MSTARYLGTDPAVGGSVQVKSGASANLRCFRACWQALASTTEATPKKQNKKLSAPPVSEPWAYLAAHCGYRAPNIGKLAHMPQWRIASV
jgi:hypothetical protein